MQPGRERLLKQSQKQDRNTFFDMNWTGILIIIAAVLIVLGIYQPRKKHREEDNTVTFSGRLDITVTSADEGTGADDGEKKESSNVKKGS